MSVEPILPSAFVLLAGIHAFATLYMCGLIWFVQVVHYPLHGLVGVAEFRSYQAAHVRRTTWVVVGPMVIELLSAILLIVAQPEDTLGPLPILGFLILIKAWVATMLLSVPAHRKLEQGFSQSAHLRLVRSNWIRTLAWTVRAPMALMILFIASKGGGV